MRCTSQPVYEVIKKHINILLWLPEYSLKDFKGDLIAGFTVGLTVVPQGLALAQLANLDPQYGLYTAFMGSYMYAIFGTCKDLVIGPTSVMALMTAEYVLKGGAAYAALLSLLCGCFQLILGIFNLGFLMKFIAAPVLSGFTSAAAIITAVMQLKGLFGLKLESAGFGKTIYNLLLNITHTRIGDLLMGVASITILLLLRKFKDQKFVCCNFFKGKSIFRAMWWSFATARNAFVVILCSLFAAACASLEKNYFSLTQEVKAGIPEFRFPQFSSCHFDTSSNSSTCTTVLHTMQDLGSGAIVIPIISLLEAIAIAKTFTRSRKLAASKEMIALGMGNIMGSFLSAYPVTGSFSRSVINNASGVRTPLGGIISGSFVLLSLMILAPVFHYIPKACLSAIIFSAVIFMVHPEDPITMWKTSRFELVPYFVTFLFSFVLGLEYGLLFGTAVSLLMLIWKQNQVTITVWTETVHDNHNLIHLKPTSTLYFPSSDLLKGTVTKALYSQPNISQCTVVMHADNFKEIDYSTVMAIKGLIASIKKENSQVIFHIEQPSVAEKFQFLNGLTSIYKNEIELQNILVSIADSGKDQTTIQTEIEESSCADALLAKDTAEVKISDNEENTISAIIV